MDLIKLCIISLITGDDGEYVISSIFKTLERVNNYNMCVKFEDLKKYNFMEFILDLKEVYLLKLIWEDLK